MFASKDLLFSKPSGYQISRSVRLRSSATAYFNRTPSSTGNQQKFTWSGWVKLGTLASNITLFSTNVAPSARFQIGTSSNAINVAYNDGTSWVLDVVTTAVYRDPSAWYHIVIYVDTTQATATNRVIIYVNGISYSYTGTNCPLNLSTNVNTAVSHSIGRLGNGTAYLDGYITEVNFIDGQALTPSSFGQTNTITGVWQPLKYTGTYGTNGFYLNFSDNSNNTATTIGKDYSGNGNNWTPNNISVTAGVTYDSMLDVPTPFADGGNGRGNYCTLNPLFQRWSVPNAVFSNANLSITTTNASSPFGVGTISNSSGKWYYEVTVVAVGTNTPGIGISDERVQNTVLTAEVAYLSNGQKEVAGTGTSYGATYTTNDVIGVAYDLDAGTVTFYKNNTSQGAISLTVTANILPYCSVILNSNFAFNFGQRPFTYTPPTGFVALNTQNLPSPTISNGANYMAASLYTGTGFGAAVPAGQTINNSVNGIGFQPDFIWIKERNGTAYHILTDSVRGVTKNIYTNVTAAEATNNGTDVTTFNSNGFSVGTDSAGDGVNRNNATVVAWQWKAGGTSSSNTAGSITSTVSVNATAGFSVLTFTGTGAVGTIGHGLGVAPSMIIVKNRPTAGTSWVTYHASVGATKYLLLNATDAATVGSAQWNNTAPTSTVFTMGNTSANTSGQSSVAYCFSEVAGYSKFGSYTGNGSADGAFVFCGFRPRYVLLKRSDTADAWVVFDSVRGTYNLNSPHLQPHLSSAEADAPPYGLDFLSNGFKCRASTASMNASGGTYIFMAFAENPTKFSLAR